MAAERNPLVRQLGRMRTILTTIKMQGDSLAYVSGQDFNNIFELLPFAFNNIIERKSLQISKKNSTGRSDIKPTFTIFLGFLRRRAILYRRVVRRSHFPACRPGQVV